MLFEVLSGAGHLILDEARDSGDAFRHPPVYGQQQFPEETDQHLLIPPGALDKLVPHPSEQIFVIAGDTRVKDIAVQRDLKVPQNTADFPPCKVDKPDLGPVFSQIVVFLLLPWLIQHHVPGRYDHFLPVEEKMPLSGRNINNLPVDPAFGPKCWEQRSGV